MTEIRVDVDLAHPPERVWCVLTEAHLVTEWLSTSRFLLTEDRRFTFRATAIRGLDDLIEGRIVASEAPHRLVMRWSSVNLHTTVTMTVRPVAGGTRLSLVQQGFLGPHGAMRRRLLQRSYVELFEGPFTGTLDRLAAAPVSPACPPVAPAVVPASGVSVPVVESKRNDGRGYARVPRQTRTPSGPSSGPSLPLLGPSSSLPGLGMAAVVAAAAGGDSDPAIFADDRGAGDASPASAPLAPPVELSSGSVLSKVGRLVLSKVGRLAKAGLRRLGARRTWTEDRRSQTVAASTALLLLLALAALLVGRATAARPAGPPQVGGGTEDTIEATVPAQPDGRTSIRRLSPEPTRGRSSALPLLPAGALPPVATASALATDGPLVATYKTEKTRVSGYDASITIRNNGKTDASDWTVVITLPLLGLTVPAVTGAVVTQNGKQFTFTPVDSTRTVAPNAAVRFTFEVAGLGHPDACTIDGQPCSGVPG